MQENVLLRVDEVMAGYMRPVVGPLSFSVAPGEVLGLGGPNGSGKSTILRAITGMARIFSGSIACSDDLTLAHQWQRPELPPELAVLGGELYALLGADIHASPEIVRPLLRKPLYALSGGQFQLIQTFACLCSPSRLVLMDEPTNNLDARALAALSKMLHELDPARAVILVSHETDFLNKHCTRVVEVGA